jgi:hypothetical protein
VIRLARRAQSIEVVDGPLTRTPQKQTEQQDQDRANERADILTGFTSQDSHGLYPSNA